MPRYKFNVELSLGILEVNQLTAAIDCADVLVKTAAVQLIEQRCIGSAYVTLLFQGDLASVAAALAAGKARAEGLDALLNAHLVARPMVETALIFNR